MTAPSSSSARPISAAISRTFPALIRFLAMDNNLRELRGIIRQKSLRIGDFTLSSGKKSSYYLDCRMTTLDPRGALLIARSILARVRDQGIRADAIGGLTLGADPI